MSSYLVEVRLSCSYNLSLLRSVPPDVSSPSGPEEWFVPGGPSVVMKDGEEGTIPCMVSNPQLNVSLYQRPSRTLVTTTTYRPGRGFTGRLNDTSYVCLAAHGEQRRESQVYYVYSIVGEIRLD